jgi:hypothetical protein
VWALPKISVLNEVTTSGAAGDNETIYMAVDGYWEWE